MSIYKFCTDCGKPIDIINSIEFVRYCKKEHKYKDCYCIKCSFVCDECDIDALKYSGLEGTCCTGDEI